MKQIVIKTPEEIAKMRHSGALLAKVFAMLDEVIVEGISTMEINDRAEAFIVEELKSRPASKGQYDFPYVLNTSVDDVVCHGVPSASKILRSGMIVNVDITLENGAVRAVQRDQRRVLGVEQVVGGVVDVPLPLFVDPQQRDVKLLFVDCIHNVFGRLQRHLMLRRFTAKNHPNT